MNDPDDAPGCAQTVIVGSVGGLAFAVALLFDQVLIAAVIGLATFVAVATLASGAEP